MDEKRWIRTGRTACPICQRNKWCSVSSDGTVACCTNVQSDRPARHNTGWIHKLPGPMHRQPDLSPRPRKATLEELAQRCKKYQSDVAPGELGLFAKRLNVDADTLRKLGIGWDGSAWTFPMFDGEGAIIGIQRRFPDGSKRCVTGSRLGLFVPPAIPADAQVLICEGMSDTAAGITLGYAAVGLPSAGQGFDHAIAMIRRQAWRRAVIVGDLDEGKPLPNGDVRWPGIEEAIKLSERLMPLVDDLRICLPPDGVKDLRKWLATSDPDVIRQTINKSPRVTPALIAAAWRDVHKNLERRKQPTWGQRASALLATLTDDDARIALRERFEEHAGFFEFDCSMSPEAAEQAAYAELEKLAKPSHTDKVAA